VTVAETSNGDQKHKTKHKKKKNKCIKAKEWGRRRGRDGR
jgi:hypothetical protein